MKRTAVAALLALCAVGATGADIGPNTYGQSLLRQVAASNPKALEVVLYSTPPKTTSLVVVASSDPARLATQAGPKALAVAAGGKTTSELAGSGDRLEVLLPLRDVSNDAIGVLGISFASSGGADRLSLEHEAERIRDLLHRHVSHAGNLLDPYPYEAGAPNGTFAQKLADEVLDRYPEIQIFAIHATPPDSDYNIIVASNIGRIGKKGDNDDMRCVFTGKPNLEVNSTGKRFEVEMQLHDRTGKSIGAVSVVYGYRAGDDKAALHQRAEKVRAELEKRIPDSDSLFLPSK